MFNNVRAYVRLKKLNNRCLKVIFDYISIISKYSDVLCSEECQTKKLLVCCKMFAFFKAIFKFCKAKKLFKY